MTTPLGPTAPPSAELGADRHARVRAMLRDANATGLIAVSHPEDMQAGDYLTGVADGIMGGAIVYLPVDGEPFAFAPPDITPQFPAMVLHGMEASGTPLWVRDWTFGFDGIPQFAAQLRERLGAGAVIGGAYLAGTPLADFLRTELPSVRFIDLTVDYDRVRAVKAPEERSSVRLAAAATETAAELLTGAIADGVSEAAVTGLVNTTIGRHGVMIGDVSLASDNGFGAPIAPASFRTIANVGNSFDTTWRTRGLPPRVLRRGQLVTTTVRCWSGGTEAHLHMTVSLGEPTRDAARVASSLGHALQKACDLVRPGAGLGEVDRTIAEWLGSPRVPGVRPHAYVLNPVWNPPTVGDDPGLRLEEGMHVAIAPYVVDAGRALTVGTNLLVTADGAEVLNTIPREVQTV